MNPQFPPHLLPTTVVGSYPVSHSGRWHFLDPLKGSVDIAISDQIRAGVDIISDGQVRGDMIRAFSRHLPGVRDQNVVGQVQPADSLITGSDIRRALREHRYAKGIVTGPTTLAHALHLSTRVYRDRADLSLDLAAALAVEMAGLARLGVCMIQIDEPILSTGVADLDTARKAVERVAVGITLPICLHVCGGLTDVIDGILDMPVAILDFEFARSPENREILSRSDLKGRMIGYGCVDSSDPQVEEQSLIEDRIRIGIDMFGPESILIDPDCGLRMLSHDSAFAKLSRMTAATRHLRLELAG
jgi:5-methyltetrahydropteroyltriglutamate--homocysteine methyltransferase